MFFGKRDKDVRLTDKQYKDLTMYLPNDESYKDVEHGRWTVGMPFGKADRLMWD